MKIDLFNNQSQNNVLIKTAVTLASNITARPYNAINIINPTLVIDYNESFLNANYIYIHECKRFYFCTVTVTTGHTMLLECAVDVLQSHADKILNANAIILRSASRGFTNITDNKYPISPYTFMKEIRFPAQPFAVDTDTIEYVLEVRN